MRTLSFTSYPEPKIKPNTHYEKKMSIIHNSGRAKRASDIVASLSGIRKLAYTSPARPRENNILSQALSLPSLHLINYRLKAAGLQYAIIAPQQRSRRRTDVSATGADHSRLRVLGGEWIR
jgi:hypothetical protein